MTAEAVPREEGNRRIMTFAQLPSLDWNRRIMSAHSQALLQTSRQVMSEESLMRWRVMTASTSISAGSHVVGSLRDLDRS